MSRASIACASLCSLATGLLLVHCSSGGTSGSRATGASDGGTDVTTIGSGGPGPGSEAAADGSAAGDSGNQPVNDAGHDSGEATGDGSSGPTLGGCPLFQPSFAYNQDISQAPLDTGSATYLAALKSSAPVIGLDYPGGEAYNIVPASQAAVAVQTSSFYGFDRTDTFFYEADAGGATAPIPSNVQYENMNTPNADHHMMILQQGTCQLFELYAWNPTGPTTGWSVLVEWDLNGTNEQIPGNLEVGSTTAAGTPLLPGVIWMDEVAAGEIQHAVDIVMPAAAISRCTYVHPASDGAWSATGTFPYGGRLRLKASYDTSKVTGTQALVVLRALQRYGMFNTDISGETRSSFRLGGLGNNQGWNQADIEQLGNLTWDDFDVVDLGTVQTMAGCH
ncbi:MAG: hypothetical protein ACLP1X_18385 [Polyangiaceae bacterium]|jgi:hypothetical protein